MGRTRTITEVDDVDSSLNETFPEHPLFPLDDDDKSIDVSYIQITRFEEGVQKYGPAVPSGDLLSEQDIAERWGGGQYIIIARAASKMDGVPGKFRRHRRIHLPGNSKPLSPDPTLQEQKISNPKLASEGSSGMSGMGDPTSFFAMMMQMQQQALERERQASERAAQQNQQFMQMFMTIMQGSKSDAQTMTATMMQMSAQQQQSMMQFVTAIMSNRGGGPEEMAKYAELMRSLGLGGAPKLPNGDAGASSESIGAMLENAADLVQGMVALKGGPGAQAVQANAQGPQMAHGGAASLLQGVGR